MSTQFQKHTTYGESLQLKALGMSQVAVAHCPAWFPEDSQHTEPFLIYATQQDEDEHIAPSPEGRICRALSRQEIEDYLMQRYDVCIFHDTDETHFTGVVLNALGNSERQEDFFVDGRDPFPALYQALCWSLEQEL